MSEPVVQVSNLVKRYGDLEAVRGIDFEVQAGETYGVPRAQLDARMKQVLDMVNLWDRRQSVVSTYSGGMKRRQRGPAVP